MRTTGRHEFERGMPDYRCQHGPRYTILGLASSCSGVKDITSNADQHIAESVRRNNDMGHFSNQSEEGERLAISTDSLY